MEEKDTFIFNNPELLKTQALFSTFDQIWKLILVELGQVDEVEIANLTQSLNELVGAIDKVNLSILGLGQKLLNSALNRKTTK